MIRMNDMVREGRKFAAKILGENPAPLTAERPKEFDDGNTVVLNYSDSRRLQISFRKDRTCLDENGEPTLKVLSSHRSLNFVAVPKQPTKASKKRRHLAV